MKRLGRLLAWIVVVLAVVLAMGVTFTIGWRPFIGPRARTLTTRKFDGTPARLARGEYLVNRVTDCMGCHAEHDWTAHDAPILPGTLGSGQDMNILKGFPGQVFAPNITPDPETGAGAWSDDQLARAIREGVGHDGRALFPFIPYLDLRALSDEDLASIIVYLRSLPPIRKQWPITQLIFPVKYLIRSVPQPLDKLVPEPDLSTPEKRGAYLVRIAGCTDCHTPQDAHGQPLPGMDFAGGFILDGPWGRVASTNITPDASGIPYYDTALFTQVIRYWLPRLVLVSTPMGLAADLAKRRRLCVVYVVPDGLERLQVGKHARQILVRHPAVDVPGHDLVESARLHESGAHGALPIQVEWSAILKVFGPHKPEVIRPPQFNFCMARHSDMI